MSLRFTRDRDDELAAYVRDRVAALGGRPSGWVPDVPANAAPRSGASEPAPHTRLRGRRIRRSRNRGFAAVADWLPLQLRLLEIRGRHLAVVAAVCLAALVFTALLLVAGRSQALVVPLRSAPTATAKASSTEPMPEPAVPVPVVTSTTPGVVVVHVSGLVQRPGLVQLPPAARVNDALQAAGGAVAGADLTGLNLARLVVDGEQIAVGVPPAPDANAGQAGSVTGSSGDASRGAVDLNRATLQELDALPGVGPVLAQRILDWRTQNGRFTSIEELQEIKGIGERTFAEISQHVRV